MMKILLILQNEFKRHLESGKIHIVRIGRQPLVAEMITFANILVGKICMILNADIWLHSISDLGLFESMEGKLYGLTRHEIMCMDDLLTDMTKDQGL